jgi:hypothetical protein
VTLRRVVRGRRWKGDLGTPETATRPVIRLDVQGRPIDLEVPMEKPARRSASEVSRACH